MNRKGFTLIEIMIVVVIIGLLAAIAIPNFIKARQTALQNACVANLKEIQGCVHVWAMDTGAASNATPTTADLVPTFTKTWPKCGTATYTVPAVDETPACPNNTSGHVLSSQ